MTCTTEHEESCTYSVYELYEGAAGEEYSTCDFEDAYREFQRLSNDAEHSGSSGITIHLYEPLMGNMLAEHHVN